MNVNGSISASLLSLVALAICSHSQAAESNEPDEAQPDLEFLEFLGQFETDEGEWIPPSSLMSEEFESLLNAVTGQSNLENDEINIDNDASSNNDN